MEEKLSLGLIGLGVMGRNLALNLADHGFSVGLWNRSPEKVERLLVESRHPRLSGFKTLAQFITALARPRKIFLLVEAGPPVDEVIAQLRPHLDPGDIIVDAGNSWFLDTRRRCAELSAASLEFVGLGISGGEEGARFGPSLMPGCSAEAYEHLRPLLEAAVAKTAAGPCVTHVGPDGSGHFVKMVHNGIEYGDMQLIAEIYDLLRKFLGLSADESAQVFEEWNAGRLASFLVELTAQVLRERDEETGQPLVDLIKDEAGQKGTGQWTVKTALELNVPVPAIAAGLWVRTLSVCRAEREAAQSSLPGPDVPSSPAAKKEWLPRLELALYTGRLCTYAQGMNLIQAGSAHYEWGINRAEIARIWTGGCIIRARILEEVRRAYERSPELENLLLAPEFSRDLTAGQLALRQVTAAGLQAGIPLPGLSSSLAYYDSLRSPTLPQNLIQAQRDAFGAHTYIRRDHPERGPVHTNWRKKENGREREE